MEDGPSRLHDAISNILGLEEFTVIKASLADRKSAWKTKLKASKDAWALLAAELGGSSDPRAEAIIAASTKKGFHLEQLVVVLILGVGGSVVLQHWSIDAEVEVVIQQLVGSVESLRGAFPPEPLSFGLCHFAGLLVVLGEERKPFIVLPKFVPLHNASLPDLIDACVDVPDQHCLAGLKDFSYE